MNESRTVLTSFESRTPATDHACTLKVIAVYDGFTSAVYAHEAVGSLAMAIRPFAHLVNNVWSFDMLARLDLRHSTIRVAAEADVIIIAAEAARALPAHVETWLVRSLQENARGSPLIVVIDQEESGHEEESPPLCEHLTTIAGHWGTPLLRNGEFDSRLERGLATELTDRTDHGGATADLNRLLSAHPAGYWGINE